MDIKKVSDFLHARPCSIFQPGWTEPRQTRCFESLSLHRWNPAASGSLGTTLCAEM